MVKNRYPISCINDLLDAVFGAKFFTSLDLTFGYHWVPISEEDCPKTAFRTPMGHFQFRVLIEGLTNAPATFQSVMNFVFHPFLRRFVVVYLDDILIYSETVEEHKLHVRQVLELLKFKPFLCRPIRPSHPLLLGNKISRARTSSARRAFALILRRWLLCTGLPHALFFQVKCAKMCEFLLEIFMRSKFVKNAHGHIFLIMESPKVPDITRDSAAPGNPAKLPILRQFLHTQVALFQPKMI
jgi:hypothetical protein